ncbi:MAG: hypothetical protein ACRC0L_06280, partial [Angustibacter sp.]
MRALLAVRWNATNVAYTSGSLTQLARSHALDRTIDCLDHWAIPHTVLDEASPERCRIVLSQSVRRKTMRALARINSAALRPERNTPRLAVAVGSTRRVPIPAGLSQPLAILPLRRVRVCLPIVSTDRVILGAELGCDLEFLPESAVTTTRQQPGEG